MKNKVLKITGLLVIVFLIVFNLFEVKAALNLSVSSVNLNEGESQTITLSAVNATGTVKISSSNASVATATLAGENWIEDGKSVSITVNGISEGNANIKISGTVSDNDGNENDYSKEINVKVSSKVKEETSSTSTETKTEEKKEETIKTTQEAKTAEKSNVATLKNLGIKPNDFSGFKTNTFSYSTTVPNDVEKVEIYAQKGHEKQSISGTGTKTLKEGINAFNIIVTAEDGKTQKTYTLNITREEKEDEEEEVEEVVFGLSDLEIENYTLKPQFKTDVYEYTVELTEDVDKLNLLNVVPTLQDATYEVIGNENFVEGENIVTIIVKSADEKKSATYQITVNKSKQQEVLIATQENNEANNGDVKIIERAKTVLSAAIAIVTLIIIIILIAIYKAQRPKEIESGSILFNNYQANGKTSNKGRRYK